MNEGTTRAIVYARVSTPAQSGEDHYSIPQQLQALREYCQGQEWKIVAEVADPGYSGASLVRPGLDQVRDLVAAGGVDVVVAQDRDRFARKVVLNGLLEEEFQRHGCKTLALNDYGDESPEGLLMRGIQGQFAEYERLKIAERTRRGKAAKVRRGRILRTKKPPFGFDYNDSGEGLEVNEAEMGIVERLFRMAADGLGPQAISTRLNAEGVSSPTGRAWSHPTIRQLLTSDLYVPYTREELSGMVSEEALSRLDAEEAGVSWFGRKWVTVTGHSASEPDENGERRYREHTTTKIRPVEERVGVPIPSHLPRQLVDEARAMLKANRPKTLKHPAREWELRGILRCSCGWKMQTHTARRASNGKTYSYYTCNQRRQYGKACGCTHRGLYPLKVWRSWSGSASKGCSRSQTN
jgi:site-specific DNA recombinase